MHEIINPNLLDKESVFENEFKGLTSVPVTYQELCSVRNTLIQRIQNELTTEERRFLLSVKERNPSWSLIGIPGIEKLPAVQWKIQNLERMSLPKHKLAVEKLKRVLSL